MERFAVFAGLDDTVVGRRRHQQHHAHADGRQPAQVDVLDPLRQLIKVLRKHHRELKTEQGLRARQHHTRFGQNVVDLFGQRRSPGRLGLRLCHDPLSLSRSPQAAPPGEEFQAVPGDEAHEQRRQADSPRQRHALDPQAGDKKVDGNP